MLQPQRMLLFLPGMRTPLWEGVECVLLCLQIPAKGNHDLVPSLLQDLPDTGISTLGDGMQPPCRALGTLMMTCRK